MPHQASLRWVLLILSGIQFCHILDFMIMMPLGPKLMRILEINSTQFGLLISSYTIAAAISGLIGSLIADRFDRKHFLIALLLGLTLGTLFCGLASSFITLLLARIIAGSFGGVLSATIFTIVSDLIIYEKRGAAIGIIMSAFSLASILGVPLSLALAEKYQWQSPFFALVMVCVILIIAVIKFIPNISKHLKHQQKIQLINIIKLGFDSNNRLALGLKLCLMLSGFTVIPYISPYMVKNVGVSELELSYIYLFGGLATIITARLIGKLADNFGAYKVFSYLIFLAFIPIYLITTHKPASIFYVLISSVPFMIFVSGRMVPAMTLITKAPKLENRGAYLSLDSSIQSLGIGLASFLGGVIINEDHTGKLNNFIFCGLIAMFFGLIALFFAQKLNYKLNQ
jgi:predicted MFS family arabinose efflux permease